MRRTVSPEPANGNINKMLINRQEGARADRWVKQSSRVLPVWKDLLWKILKLEERDGPPPLARLFAQIFLLV